MVDVMLISELLEQSEYSVERRGPRTALTTSIPAGGPRPLGLSTNHFPRPQFGALGLRQCGVGVCLCLWSSWSGLRRWRPRQGSPRGCE